MSTWNLFQLYQDQWGRVWERRGFDMVWNEKAGYGGWFGGKGLTPINKPPYSETYRESKL